MNERLTDCRTDWLAPLDSSAPKTFPWCWWAWRRYRDGKWESKARRLAQGPSGAKCGSRPGGKEKKRKEEGTVLKKSCPDSQLNNIEALEKRAQSSHVC